jgi:hypothetical protein
MSAAANSTDLLYNRIVDRGWDPDEAAKRSPWQSRRAWLIEKQRGKPAISVAAEMQAYGASQRQIGRELGVSARTAGRWARQGFEAMNQSQGSQS